MFFIHRKIMKLQTRAQIQCMLEEIWIFILHVSTSSWVNDWELQPAFQKYKQ